MSFQSLVDKINNFLNSSKLENTINEGLNDLNSNINRCVDDLEKSVIDVLNQNDKNEPNSVAKTNLYHNNITDLVDEDNNEVYNTFDGPKHGKVTLVGVVADDIQDTLSLEKDDVKEEHKINLDKDDKNEEA